MLIQKNNAGRLALAAALLLGTSAFVNAQPTPATPAAPAAGADDRLVDEAEATHVANLTGATGTGTAWFLADAQNNTLRWTIEVEGVNVGGANIACPPGEGAAAGGGAAAAADTTLMVALTAQIVAAETAAAPAGGAPAAPAGGAPAAPAAGAPAAPAAGAPAAPAGGANAGAAPAADATAATEVLNLLEGAEAGDNMDGPLEGEAANIEGPVFAQIEAGACFLNIQTAAATTPATPAAGGATPPAGGAATPPAGGTPPATPPAGGTPPATPPAGGATPPPAG